MTPQIAEPLPECLQCEAPMNRHAWAALDGVCTACTEANRRAAATEARLQPWYDR